MTNEYFNNTKLQNKPTIAINTLEFDAKALRNENEPDDKRKAQHSEQHPAQDSEREHSAVSGVDGKRGQDQVKKVQQVVNLALQIKITVGKERLGAEELLTAEYSNINWAGVQDTKEDVRKVVARSCSLDPTAVLVREAIPDSAGIQSPSLMISFNQELTDEQMDLMRKSIVGYFDLISNPEKALPSLPGECLDEELEESIRETAKNFCARRNGRPLPCEILISGASFAAPVKCKTKVAKPHHQLIPGDQYDVVGKADGFKCSKHKLEFLLRKVTKSKKGVDKVKFKLIKIGFDQSKFEKDVIGLPHGRDVVIKLAVQDFTHGKKKWTSLMEIISTGSKRKN